ncbi:hypothetical protein [Hyphomicrobium sp.]|uniref:DUF7282 domain-containing protein n=1 Tax=Hyphomicrobium sp. TaxID=82 RepID=UPI001DBE7140|nr:hypothetical protein [Hyphomicrobium sp.]MBY0559433.1 hypothetical protein [Hyphomicrobium sp.]
MTISRVSATAAAVMAAGMVMATSAFAADPGTPASVIAMNQKPKGESVSITYAFAPADGTLAIFSVDPAGHASAQPLGSAALTRGDHRDVKIKLNEELKPGTTLWAVARSKDGKPFRNVDGPAEQTFNIL